MVSYYLDYMATRLIWNCGKTGYGIMGSYCRLYGNQINLELWENRIHSIMGSYCRLYGNQIDLELWEDRIHSIMGSYCRLYGNQIDLELRENRIWSIGSSFLAGISWQQDQTGYGNCGKLLSDLYGNQSDM